MAKKPFKPLAEMKARINAITRAGMPEVNAMTEGFLERSLMLDGIRVLDLSRVIAGPYCAMMLADLGADVVKVERPGRGDDMRYLGTSKDGMSLGFATINRNKRAIAVDLQHPEGLKIIHRAGPARRRRARELRPRGRRAPRPRLRRPQRDQPRPSSTPP